LVRRHPGARPYYPQDQNLHAHRQNRQSIESEFPGLSAGFSTGVPVEDMYALAECDYIIGPVSSFTQWASFYGNKPLFHLTDLDGHVERERFRVSYLAEVPH